MYKEIDELVEAIIQDDVFQNYKKCNQALENEKTLALLSRNKTLQEDYLRLKSYGHVEYIKENLKEIKKEMMNDQKIQDYYQSYHDLQALLAEVTELVFQNISDELFFDQYHYGE